MMGPKAFLKGSFESCYLFIIWHKQCKNTDIINQKLLVHMAPEIYGY